MLKTSEKRLYLYLILLLLIQSLFALSSPPLVAVTLAAGEAELVKFPLNNATSEQLQQIKGVGPVIASRIIEQREKLKGFKEWQDVLEVKGIGQKRLELLKQSTYLTEPKARQTDALAVDKLADKQP